MNDFMRPALYEGFHKIIPLIEIQSTEKISTDVVGPICETTDKLISSDEFYDVGTYCKIADWEQMDDGLLGITARGKYRYRVLNSSIQSDNLIVADIESMEEPGFIDVPKELMPYSDFLKNILEQYPKFYHDDAPKYFTESGWVGSRLAEILPMPTKEKQVILETEDYLVRLYKIKDCLLYTSDAADE